VDGPGTLPRSGAYGRAKSVPLFRASNIHAQNSNVGARKERRQAFSQRNLLGYNQGWPQHLVFFCWRAT